MSRAVDAVFNLPAIAREDLQKDVTNALLDAILTKLEEILALLKEQGKKS